MFLPKTSETYAAPLNEGSVEACRKISCGTKGASVQLNRTLPSLLDEGCKFEQTNISGRASFSERWSFSKKKILPASISHYKNGSWQSWTLLELRRISEELAFSLYQYPGIEKGNRAALLMDSNVPFVIADIGCLLARLVTVPISPEQQIATTKYMLEETEASVLFVSHLDQVKTLLPMISDLSTVRLVVVADNADDDSSDTTFQEALRTLQWTLPEATELTTLSALS